MENEGETRNMRSWRIWTGTRNMINFNRNKKNPAANGDGSPKKFVDKLKRELESIKKNFEAEKLCSNIRRLMTDLGISRLSVAEKEENSIGEFEEKKAEMSVFHTQQKFWKESLVLNDKELGLIWEKVELQGLTMAELSLKVESLQKGAIQLQEF
ncbi:Uncharacterized protein Fot_28663 [Forsythia ovata]|uniref:Uncharacterized protein n=1 Tax=Forsythia ovata TaxID=205694 RepID=A0ABD1TPM2_9LAMI